MLQLQQHADEITARGLQVAVVTFEDAARAQAYQKDVNLAWPLLIDADRGLYAAYGMHEGTTWEIMGPTSWSAYIKLMLRGRRPRRPTGNVHQLGGDVLIDPGGIVRVHHVSSGPADRPSVTSLLEVVQDAASEH